MLKNTCVQCFLYYLKYLSVYVSHAVFQEGVETIDVIAERLGGTLEGQSVEYSVLPGGNEQFFGATKVLYFPPGVTRAEGRILAKNDSIPEVRTIVGFLFLIHIQ